MRVLGVDGCRDGWVAVALDAGVFAGAWVVAGFDELVDDDAEVIGVDIPLGETTPGARAAEAHARQRLGSRHSTVFTPPPLVAAAAASYDDAKEVARRLTGKGISKQAWHLLPKMVDAATAWREQPERVREIHPECSFAEMTGAPLQSSKRTPAGLEERARVLACHGIDLPRDAPRPSRASADDVLDAGAVAWSAHRVALGQARSLPDPPERDAAGRPVAIWC